VDFISAKFTARFVRDEPAETILDGRDYGSSAHVGIAMSASAAANLTSIRDLQHLIACTLAPSQRASARWRMGPHGMTISRWSSSFLVTVANESEMQ
jgi:hypothetical protein